MNTRTLVILMLLAVGGVYAPAHPASGLATTTDTNPMKDVGFLGVGLVDVDADKASVLKLGDKRGAEVIAVEEGSPADNYGIRVGDILLSYNGETVLGGQQLGRLVRETPPGRKVKLQYWRDGKLAHLSLAVGAAKALDTAVPTQMARMGGLPDLSYGTVDVPSPMLLWRSSMLGVECEGVDSQLAHYFGVDRGVLVRFVLDDSSAKKAGMKAGDVITSVGGRQVATPRDITAALRLDQRDQSKIPVVITRNHKDLTLHVAPPKQGN